MKSKIIKTVLLAIFVVICLPLAIDWLIIGNKFPSNISNSDWVSFFGAYIGSLIGAIVSLVGIIITIRYTNEQNKEDRELQVRPYCAIRYVHDEQIVGTKKIIAELNIGCEPKENNGPKYVSILYIKNIGLGPAVEFEFKIDKIDDGRKHYPILMQNNTNIENNFVSILQPGEEAAFPIQIFFNFDNISEEDFIDYGGSGIFRYGVRPEVSRKYKNFNIIIHVYYYDMFKNQYAQVINLTSQMSVSGKFEEKKAEHSCDIYLKEITTPKKIEK